MTAKIYFRDTAIPPAIISNLISARFENGHSVWMSYGPMLGVEAHNYPAGTIDRVLIERE